MKITVWLLPVFAALALGQTFQWPFQGAGPRRGQPFVVPSRESAFHDEDDAYWPHYSHEDDAGNAYWNNVFHPAYGQRLEPRRRQPTPASAPLEASQRFLASMGFFNFLLNRETSTLTLTVTTALVSSCIPATQFSSGATNPCAFRRRRGAIAFDLADVTPSGVEPLEPSVQPSLDGVVGRGVEVWSSQNDAVVDDDDNGVVERPVRRARQVRLTVTETSFSFTATVIKKTVNLATSAGLSCLPAPYVVC